MTEVAVTGAAGPVGRRVVARLLADPAVELVVAIDRDPMQPGLAEDFGGRLRFHRMHLRSGDLRAALDGIAVVCHLAGSDPLEGTEPDHDVHTVTGLLDAIEAVGARQLIVRSSATVYGAWPDNPVPMAESVPIRPNGESDWVRTRAEVEARVCAFAEAHPEVTVSILRPCTTVSPAGADELGRVLAAARVVASGHGAAPMQFVHADDVADAVEHLRRTEAAGTFNVAPDGALDAELVRALVGGAPRLPLPEWMSRRLTSLGWRYQVVPTPPGFVPYVHHPWVVANDRLRGIGWEPRHTNEEAFVAGHAAAPWAQISPQRRQEIALGVAVLGIVGSVAGVAALARRRLRG